MDVAQNVGYGLRQRKVGKAEEERRVTEALALVRLAGYGERRTWEMSGGQQQRVALARALVNRPTVLLLDEPLGALDLKLRKEMQLELKALQREVGITFVYVTHDQEEALTMSDVIVVMRDGRIQQQGDPTELYERPVNRFVADFIGTSNPSRAGSSAVDGRPARAVVETDGGLRLRGGSPTRRPHPAIDSQVTVAIRPEQLDVRDGSATGQPTPRSGTRGGGAGPRIRGTHQPGDVPRRPDRVPDPDRSGRRAGRPATERSWGRAPARGWGRAIRSSCAGMRRRTSSWWAEVRARPG